MVFKKIDRHVGIAFLSRFAFCLGLVAALYVGFDLLKRIDELGGSDSGNTLFLVVRYYAYVLPMFMLDLVPAAVLIAAGMVLVRMSTNRELLALRASGTSTYRVLAPIFVWTVVISTFVLAARDKLMPDLMREQVNLRQSIEGDVRKSVTVVDPVSGTIFYIGEVSFDQDSMSMRNVSADEFHLTQDGSTRKQLRRSLDAEQAAIGDEGLLLEHIRVLKGYGPGPEFTPQPVPDPLPDTMLVPTTITRETIARAAEESDKSPGPSSRTLPELLTLMHEHPRISAYAVTFHWKLASFFTPFVLLLVGIPCLIGQEHVLKSRFVGVLVSIAVAGVFYALIFIFKSIGESGTVHPALAGWLPATIAGSLGLYLFESRLS